MVLKICVSVVSFVASVAVIFILRGFKLENKISSHMKKQDEIAAQEKCVRVDKKLLKIIRISGIAVVVSSLIFTLITCFYDFFDLQGNVSVMIGLCVVFWLCTICDCSFFILVSKKVIYDEEGFTVINAFGKRKSYSYEDIVEVSGTSNIKIKFKKGCLRLFNTLSGLQQFMDFLQDKI